MTARSRRNGVTLIERRVDGLILTGATRSRRIRKLIGYHGLPASSLGWGTDPTEMPSVSFNNAEGVRLAIEHLAWLGHRRIGFVCGRASVNDRAAERLRSYHATMQRLGLTVDTGRGLGTRFRL